MACGIYVITRRSTGQMYVGQSIHIYQRFYDHITRPSASSRIDNAIKKHGKDDFELKILKCCKPRYLNRFEKLFIKKYNTFKDNFHYNLTPGGEGTGFGEDNPSFKDYPRIINAGNRNGRTQYCLVYRRNRMRFSYDKEKLQKYIDDGTWIKFYTGSDKEFIRRENELRRRAGSKHPLYRDDIDVEEILEMLKSNVSMADISSEKNFSYSALKSRLAKELDEETYAFVKMHNMERLQRFGKENPAWVDLDDEKIYDEYHNEGMSFSKIGQKRGVSSEVIKRHIKYFAKENNLPFIERDMYSYAVKDYPRIIKTGTDERGNPRYGLVYKKKCIKESIFYERLEEYLNDENLLEELFEEFSNRKESKEKELERILKQNEYIESNGIKYYRVWKSKHKRSRTGFYWAYSLKVNGKKKTLTSIDIKDLERKVIANGWVWKEISDDDKKSKSIKKKKTPEEISIEAAKRKTKTGIYRVKCHKNRKEIRTGVLWEYSYNKDGKKKSMSNMDLNYLKKRVLSENLPWIILDEDKATQSFKFNNSLNIPKENIRKEYTLWDKSKLKYRKSAFKRYGNNNPALCFRLKFNKKEVACGAFYDFLTPELMYDLINDFLD